MTTSSAATAGEPTTGKPTTEKPTTGEPTTGKPATEEPAPLLRRLARTALTRAVRGRQPQGGEWGEALLSDFECVEGTWESVRWALGGIRVARGERRGIVRSKPLTVRTRVVRGAVVVTVVFLAALGIGRYVLTPEFVPSDAMAPTLVIGDRFVVDRLAVRITGVERGDVVEVGVEVDGRTDPMVKRVIGLGGDHIECRDGALIRNGGVLDEPYAKGRTDCTPVDVPGGHLYVLGDNREESADSRNYGMSTEDDVLGRVVGKVWSFVPAVAVY